MDRANEAAAIFAQAASHPGRTPGHATIAEIATSAGMDRGAVLGSLAELMAAGYLRPVFGRPRPRIRAAGRLVLADGGDAVTLLMLLPPAEPLGEAKAQALSSYLAAGASLGALALLYGSLQVADDDGTFTSNQLEDYLGARRGLLR